MRVFSMSISFLFLWTLVPSTIGLGADDVASAEVRAVESLWTRKEGSDWPRMLCDNYDSHSPEKGILTKWPKDGLKVMWTVNTGRGYGNGVAAHGRWFQFDRFAAKERLSCLNAETGKQLWTWEVPVDYRDAYGYNNGPRCSPVVDGDRVYVFGVTGTLACISIADGSEIWSKNTNDEFNVIQNFFGVGASPLIYEDMILVMIGGSPAGKQVDITKAAPSGSAMVAFDKLTGKEKYRVGNYLASYSAPVVHKIQGRDVCLALVREGLMTFNPKDGSGEQFFPWRAQVLESVNAASPLVWKDRILISETYERGSVLLKLSDKGLSPLWKDGATRREQVLRAHWSTPILHDNYLYASSGRNEPDTDFRCIELQESAENADSVGPVVHWATRNRDRMTGLFVDDHVLMLGEYGTLQLVALNTDRHTVVAEMQLGQMIDQRDKQPLVQSPAWAPPVLSHGLLYVRGDTKVVCLELIPQ